MTEKTGRIHTEILHQQIARSMELDGIVGHKQGKQILTQVVGPKGMMMLGEDLIKFWIRSPFVSIACIEAYPQ